MNEQIEQLKADKAALEAAQIVMRKHGGYVSELVIETGIRIQDKIKELERQADDPWKEAKQLIRYWGRDDLMLDNNGRLLQQVALYVRHLELEVKQLESTDASNAEPLCPRRVAATAAVVMQQSMSFLIETNQMKQFPHEHAQRHADTIHLLKQSAGTEAKPYKTIAVKDLETCN
jgi:hypothetical protein